MKLLPDEKALKVRLERLPAPPASAAEPEVIRLMERSPDEVQRMGPNYAVLRWNTRDGAGNSVRQVSIYLSDNQFYRVTWIEQGRFVLTRSHRLTKGNRKQ
jgi:hypothetical protein